VKQLVRARFQRVLLLGGLPQQASKAASKASKAASKGAFSTSFTSGRATATG
jgi:hypothetical protein